MSSFPRCSHPSGRLLHHCGYGLHGPRPLLRHQLADGESYHLGEVPYSPAAGAASNLVYITLNYVIIVPILPILPIFYAIYRVSRET